MDNIDRNVSSNCAIFVNELKSYNIDNSYIMLIIDITVTIFYACTIIINIIWLIY